jgi:vancomycin resistance protein YoaR
VVLIAVLAGVLVGAAMCLFQYSYNYNRFPPQVHIGAVEVGGQERESAIQALDSWLAKRGQAPLTLVYNDYCHQIAMAEAGAGAQVEKVVDEALREVRDSLPWWTRLIGREQEYQTFRFEIPIVWDKEKLTGVLEQIKPDLELVPQNCKVGWQGGSTLGVTPEVNGKRVNLTATLEKIPLRWGQEYTVPIVVEDVLPDVCQADFADVTLLAAYTTNYNSGDVDRSSNLATAARALSGTIVPAGQEFSFNTVVGPRNLATGYREAIVIQNNEFTPGVGGGICQVSSTLYNACLLSGLEIVERHNHSVAIAYVPLGLDATINYGSLDFRFRNNTGGAVYLQSSIGNGRLTIRVFGPKNAAKKIKLERTVEATKPFEVVKKPDATVPSGETRIKQKGVSGYTVRSWRVFADENGTVIKREPLGRDVYRPLNQMVLVGPTVPVSAEINPGIEEVVPPEPESDNGSVVPEPENLPVESDDSILDGANPIPDVDGIIIGE